MNIHTFTLHRPTASRRTAAAVATVAITGLALPGISPARADRVDGVRAAIVHRTLEVRGGAAANNVALRLQAGDPSHIQVDVANDGTADFTFPRSELSAIDISMGPGNDTVRIDDSNGAFTNAIPTTIGGGPGNDTLIGGAGNETFLGGPGNDTVNGGKGNDTALLGPGDDTFVWNPGDGSDVIEGQSGNDTMLFNGANAPENVSLSANGDRLTFFRNVGNVTMDTHGVENVDFNALGGADNITVDDLTGTGVRQVDLDLAGTLGGSAGDGAVDNVTVNGTNGDDQVDIAGNGAGADVTGLAASISVRHAEPADILSVNTLPGNDSVHATGAFGMQVFANGAAL
jgi:Ca2+-binding RTX toxin-like protein